MLTSPVNATSPISSGLKPHASSTDIGAGHSPVLAGALVRPAPVTPPEIETQTTALLATVNAVAATAGGKTVLQSLAFSVATLLNISRLDDEPLTALFLRIASAIDVLPADQRQQIEIRSGLKALKIALSDLPAALRNPDGPFAARLTAMAEAPLARPGQTSANAASTAYLQQGTNTGHTEETLAMRAAARNNAAGQGLFSPEARRGTTDGTQTDAKQLQNQLKTMFEANSPQAVRTSPDTVRAESRPMHGHAPASEGGTRSATSETQAARPDALLRPETRIATADAILARADAVASKLSQLGSSSQPLGTRLREIAREVIEDDRMLEHLAQDSAINEKADASPRRVETMLTLKGFAEAVTALPARAAEILGASTLPEGAAPTTEPPGEVLEGALSFETWSQEVLESEPEAIAAALERPADTLSQVVEEAEPKEAAVAGGLKERTYGLASAASPEPAMQHQDNPVAANGIPFVQVTTAPARDTFLAEIEEEEEARDRSGEETADESEDDSKEPRRARDEYDAIKDDVAEDEPALVINRDSSESDRAFAMYQRMSGV